jgi:hypothetical protein
MELNYLKLAEKAGVNMSLAQPSYKEFLILYGDLVAEATKNDLADKIAKMPFGDTSHSMSVWIKSQ